MTGVQTCALPILLNKNVPILVVDDEVFEGSIVIINKLKELA